MQRLFEAWQDKLRDDPDLWTIRHCLGAGGLIWRNRAYLKNRCRFGMFPSETMAWSCASLYVSPEDFARVEAAYRMALAVRTPVMLNVTLKIPHRHPVELRNIFLLAVEGDMNDGLVVSHQLPF